MRLRTPRAARRGFTFVEVQGAFLALGLYLTSLGALTVAQLRLTARLEARLDEDIVHFLVPADELWARKLGVPARHVTSPPTPAYETPVAEPANEVEIVSFNESPSADSVDAEVTVTEIPPPE